MKEKWRNYLINLMISVVVVLVFFLILEGFLSVLAIGDVEKFRGWGFNPECCGDLRPNQSFVAKVDPKHPYLIETNSLGLRGDEVDLVSGKTRILAIGDSFTFGPYVNNKETWPAYLEQEFEEKVEVLNAGVAGYTIEEELDYLQEKGIKLKPDLVILQFSPNDITDFNKPKERRGRSSRLSNLGFVYKIFNFFRDRSHLFATALELITERQVKEVRPTVGKILEENKEITYHSGQEDSLFLRYEGLFEELVGFITKNNLKLMVVAIPELGQSKDLSLDDPNNFLDKLCQEKKVPFLDLHRAFYKKRNENILYLTPWNAHLSRHGNKLVAEELAKFIARNKIMFKEGQFDRE